MQAIVDVGPVSRASISKITGLSKQTVSEIVANLETDGWVRTVGQTGGHVGRRAIIYEIAPDAATVASVDLGGTKVRAAICDLTGKILAERVEPTERAGGMDAVEQIARMVRLTVRDLGGDVGGLRIVVVGVPGVPDPKSGAVLLAPNIADIDQIDIAGSLSKLLDAEIFVENDVNLAALGEYWLGGRGEGEDLVFISVGTGIGAGIVIGGQLLRGSSGGAGEIGFLPFGADPFEAESLKTGALERVAAAGAILDLYHSLSGRKTDVLGIFEGAGAGDESAIRTLDAIAGQIARAAAAIVAVIDPAVIVVGGSIGAHEGLREGLTRFLSECCPRQVGIEQSRLGNHAALAGGVYTALSHLHISLFAEGQKGAAISVPPPEIEKFMASAS